MFQAIDSENTMKELLSIYGIIIEIIRENEQFNKAKEAAEAKGETIEGQEVRVFSEVSMDTYILH